MTKRGQTQPYLATYSSHADVCFPEGGEMGELIRSKNWAATPLGPVEAWPESMRTSVRICLENSYPMCLMWGPDARLLYNDAYRPFLDPERHPRALGQPVLEVFPEVRDDVTALLRTVFETGKAVAAEERLFVLQRNGYLEESYLFFSYSPLRDESGTIRGVLCTLSETTQRVLAERRLRTLRVIADRTAHAETVEQALAEAARALDPADVPFALLYVTRPEECVVRLAATSGLDADSAIAQSVIDLRDEAASIWPFRRVAELGRAELVSELGSRFGSVPGGPWPEPTTQAVVLPIAQPGTAHEYGFLVAGVSPRRALDDNYRNYFQLVAHHIATAVSNAKAREAERDRLAALAELDRAKTTFFYNVSHEFRTPLMLLLGPLDELLAKTPSELSGTIRDELETMQRNAQRLLRLVTTLLDFSRIEAGRARAVYEPVDLATTTQELASVFRSAIECGGLRLLVECRPLPEPVYVDVEMWEKIVLNLLSNAFKFTFSGEIEVSLQSAGEFVVLQVRDTGIGIPPAELPHLFKRFHRVQGAKSRSYEGTGIGLALVQDLVRLHGGAIDVESELGRGSCFRVTVRTGTAHLPADHVQPTHARESTAMRAKAFVDEAMRSLPISSESITAGPDEPINARPAGSSAHATAGARLLLADDNADMRDYLRRVLGQHWNIVAVGDGDAALEQALRDPPDLVLSDVMMPGLDGFGLLRRLRADARTRQVPFMMLSARAGEEARIEGLNAGADDYLIKPFSARELVARVASQLVLSHARRALEEQRATLYSHFMQAPTPICVLRGRRHLIELANPRTCEVWGRRYEEIIGRPLLDALPEMRSQGFRRLLDDVLQSGEPYIGKEVPAEFGVEGQRRTIYFNFVYSPLRDLHGQVDGILIIAFDVTDEIRAREELARTIHYNQMFTGILGHDLRNPLGAITATAEIMTMVHADDDRIAEPAARILSSSRRMTRMIEQLLDLTRLRLAGGLAIERKHVDLSAVLSAVLGEIERGVPEWKVQLKITGDARGHWDPDRLAQVLSNLLGNAAAHGAREVPTRIYVDGRDAFQLSATFANKGAIPPELLPHLFEPFRGTAHTRLNSRGLGLGLYIAKEIIEAHGGHIQVTSSEEAGTEFRVVLPRR